MNPRSVLVLTCLSVLRCGFGQEAPIGGLIGPEGQHLPLQKLSVHFDVRSGTANVVVRQEFINPFATPIEVDYVFPLPDQAAVHGFTMELGPRKIVGEIQLRADAEAAYQQAKSEGKTAALLHQDRPNIFQQRIANILPIDRIIVEIRYIEDLPYTAGWYELVFPLTIGRRYLPHHGVEEPVPPTGPPPALAPFAQKPSCELMLSGAIDAGVPLRLLASPSHDIASAAEDANRASFRFESRGEDQDRDFILRWCVRSEQPRSSLRAHRLAGEGTLALTIQPEAPPEIAQRQSREVFLVIDCSGSMDGTPLAAAHTLAHRTLDALAPGDTFQIACFSSETARLAPSPLPVTPQNLVLGHRFIDGLISEGGTEMSLGIREALADPRDPERLRVVHFLTDGHIGNEDEITEQIRNWSRGARIFPCGIGSAPSRYLIDRMARVGRGIPSYITGKESTKKFQAHVQCFVDRVLSPAVLDLQIDWGGLDVTQINPISLPDLFHEQPLTILGRYATPGTATIRLHGARAGLPWEQRVEVTLPAHEPSNALLPLLWARAQIRELELFLGSQARAAVRERIKTLALEHRLMSSETSFVAIDHAVVTMGSEPRVVRQLLALPQDSSAFEGLQSKNQIGLAGSGFGGRRNSRTLGAYGHSQGVSEESVEWLAKHQSPEGHFDADEFMKLDNPSQGTPCDGGGTASDVTTTSLAILAFLGKGSTHREGPRKDNVTRALKWLYQQQAEDGCISTEGSARRNSAHALAALAFSETFGLTKSGVWKPKAQRAVDYAVSQQREDGSFRAEPGGEADLTTTTLTLMVIYSAKSAGLEIDEGVVKRARSYLELRDDVWSLAARLFAGDRVPGTLSLSAGIDTLVLKPFLETATLDYWSAYLTTILAFHAGESAWRTWEATLSKSLLPRRRIDGHFKGSFDPTGAGMLEGGRITSTALGLLMMEIYYRYGRTFGMDLK